MREQSKMLSIQRQTKEEKPKRGPDLGHTGEGRNVYAEEFSSMFFVI